eukprot:gnl/TRDRNA2_/TRDRNA2_172324_c3_seq9.p1 gnl/TRDRNA2_/TRDRNA2_172324_c3~~gnl/TRDRNA2_/TRDRNA2_172324_c3_seq9.p1  ORF type:complete len:486 (-),score=143.74 gnl/TRDRNA2_/TRDRNA2_172324_c3_seq9:75-1457(-)
MAGDDIFMLVVDLVFYTAMLIIIDVCSQNSKIRAYFTIRGKCEDEIKFAEDENVVKEKKRVSELDPRTQILVVDDVYKSYSPTAHAVRGVSFAVPTGQVFGLLGLNGAGKTTTFKMLCGQTLPSAGKIHMCGIDVSESVEKVRKLVGYCAQFDAHLGLMTITEHLELYSRLRGLSGQQLTDEVESKIKTFGLEEHRDSRACHLSGGTKRKMSVAMAAVGSPPVILLDEPSAGMDANSRRFMWGLIRNLSQQTTGGAVVLTTHSMDEADALCSYLAIQVHGQFKCIGTPTQLKEWYGQGLSAGIQLEVPTQQEIEAFCARWGKEPGSICQLDEAADFCKKEGHGREKSLGDRSAPFAAGKVVSKVSAFAEWHLLEDKGDAVEAFLIKQVGAAGAQLVEKAAGSLKFKLVGNASGGGPKPIGELFQILEEQRAALGIADFQISQATLEQTFNRFAAESAVDE